MPSDFQGDLSEDFRLAALAQRSTEEKYKMYAIRLVVNLFVLVISGGAAWLIYQATQISIQVSFSPDKQVSGPGKTRTHGGGNIVSYMLPVRGKALQHCCAPRKHKKCF